MLPGAVNLIHDRHLRGHTDLGWINSYHTFSFGDFQDSSRLGFRSLHVINENRLVPGAGLDELFYRNTEIFTYVLDGKFEHQDNLGNQTVLHPGDVQLLSTGTGIWYSELNPSSSEPLHFLQIWMTPEQRDRSPHYQQRSFPPLRPQTLQLIAAKDGRSNALTLHQDMDIYVATLEAGQTLTYSLSPDRYGWLQILRGIATLNDNDLRAGDGVQIVDLTELSIATSIGAEMLLLDLA